MPQSYAMLKSVAIIFLICYGASQQQAGPNLLWSERSGSRRGRPAGLLLALSLSAASAAERDHAVRCQRDHAVGNDFIWYRRVPTINTQHLPVPTSNMQHMQRREIAK